MLDIPMLEQYLELAGPKKLITDGLAVFEDDAGYVSVLESNLTAQDKKALLRKA
ncbi:MAG: hypothetical protein ACLRP3_14160 [Escherichia sp.]